MAVSEAIAETSFFLIKFTSHSCCHLLPNTHRLKQPYAVIGSFSEMANHILNHSMTFFPCKSETELVETLKSHVCGYQGCAQVEPLWLLMPSNFCPWVTIENLSFSHRNHKCWACWMLPIQGTAVLPSIILIIIIITIIIIYLYSTTWSNAKECSIVLHWDTH